jgi:hypothetical protein
LLKFWGIDKCTSNYGFFFCVVYWITRQLTKGTLGAEPSPSNTSNTGTSIANGEASSGEASSEQTQLIRIIHDRVR